MCGICGEYGHPDRKRVESMANSMRHRGPDDSGFYTEPTVCLGIRRLSIMDLRTGHQPMTNEDGSVVVVFNGEIYNYQEIRQNLQQHGHRFRSRSDTEVLVHLYEEEGEEFVNQLRGMFAVALWDSPRKRLLLARDRLGIKPLYVVGNGQELAFASELRALIKVGHAPLEVDPVAIAQYVGFPCIPAPRTAVPGVRALKPAEMIIVDGHSIQSRMFWRLSFPQADKEGDPSQVKRYAEGLREKLTQAVKIRLRSDVPLGAFLSGGLDSSTVVRLMGLLQDNPVHTFSIAFIGDEREFSTFNELRSAQTVAREFGTEHTEATFDGNDVRARLFRMIWAMDQPSGDALQHYLVSEVAKTSVTVAMSGTGADEVFAGYKWFRELSCLDRLSKAIGFVPQLWKVRLGQWIANLPRSFASRGPLRKLGTLLGGEAGFLSRYRLNRRLYREEELAELLTPRIWDALVSAADEADELAEYDTSIQHTSVISATSLLQLKTDMVNLLLRDQDAVSMAHSLEVRLPLIDHEIVEFAASIPSSLKLHGNQVKYILRHSMADILPLSILERTKKGFVFPMHLWMRNEFKDVVRKTLSQESIIKRGFFHYEPVSRLTSNFFAGREPFFKIWNLVALELWCRLFLDAKVFDDPGMRPIEDLL